RRRAHVACARPHQHLPGRRPRHAASARCGAGQCAGSRERVLQSATRHRDGVAILIDAPATDLLTRLRRREVTSSDLIRACLDRIEALNPMMHAFLHVDREGALRAAREWDGRYARGDALPPRAGLPVAVKDIICTTGIVGMKPTYGRVSRYGLVAFASSLDQIGPMARTVSDAALLLHVLAGRDPKDSTSVDLPVDDYPEALSRGVRGLRIGIAREAFGQGLQREVRAAVQAAATHLDGLGAVLTEVSLPSLPYALPTYYLLATSEASANLARYDGVQYGLRVPTGDLFTMYTRTRRQGFGNEVKRRIMLGTYALSAGYYEGFFLKAQRVRTLIRQEFLRALERVDLVLMPVSPTVPFRLGEKVDDPLQMYLADIYTIPVNLAGLPGISVPCGFPGGLPVGLQLIGKPFDEATVLRAAHAYEQTTEWHTRRPPIVEKRERGIPHAD